MCIFFIYQIKQGNFLNFQSRCKQKIKLVYNSQNDHLMHTLSVEETLGYCCQLRAIQTQNNVNPFDKNSGKTSIDIEVQKLIKDFDLKKFAKTPTDKCSGGQRRRLSIALELIFAPSVLLLDEPTSGLDSFSSLELIKILKQMSENTSTPMIIAVVIHQPNPNLLSYFDDLYVLSCTGQCIYEGPKNQLIEKMSTFDLQCSQYCNPSDFSIEIGSGYHGLEVIPKLAEEHYIRHKESVVITEDCLKMSKIIADTQKHTIKEQISMVWPLTKRCFLMGIKNPNQYLLQFFAMILILFLLFILHIDYKIGTYDACMPKPSFEFARTVTLGLFDMLNPEYSPFPNMAFDFYSLMFIVFMSMFSTVLSVPLEITVFKKEYSNGWYSLSSYFIAKNISDLPQNFIFPVIYSAGAFLITEQKLELWRFLGFISVLILISILAQGMGFLVSALFADNVLAAVIVGAIINIPLLIFSGILIKLEAIPKYLQPFTYLSYYKVGLELLIVLIYGFNRCEPWATLSYTDILNEMGGNIIPLAKCIDDYEPELIGNFSLGINYLNSFQNRSVSFPMIILNYDQADFVFNYIFLIIYAILLRVFAYFLLVFKLKVK